MNINYYNPYVRQELYLMHHGIAGQKWGKKNGPPYPLGVGDHSASEKKAGWQNSLNDKKSRKLARKQMQKDLNRLNKQHASAKSKSAQHKRNADHISRIKKEDSDAARIERSLYDEIDGGLEGTLKDERSKQRKQANAAKKAEQRINEISEYAKKNGYEVTQNKKGAYIIKEGKSKAQKALKSVSKNKVNSLTPAQKAIRKEAVRTGIRLAAKTAIIVGVAYAGNKAVGKVSTTSAKIDGKTYKADVVNTAKYNSFYRNRNMKDVNSGFNYPAVRKRR